MASKSEVTDPKADHTTDTHTVDNADAKQPGGTDPGPRPEPGDARKAALEADAARRAENLRPPTKAPELRSGVDPITGAELDIDAARAAGRPVMVPESKGRIETDVTFPSHIQAPPVEQLDEGGLTKATSSTKERNAGAKV